MNNKKVCAYYREIGECLCNNDPDDPGECVYENGIEPKNPAIKCKFYTGKNFYGFTCSSRQNYFPHLKTTNEKSGEIDRVMFGIYCPNGGCEAEMSMVWHQLSTEICPCFSVFSDAFKMLGQDVILRLICEFSKIPNPQMTSEYFSEMLINLGFKDMSDIPLKKEKDL